ncbi:MAG: GDSL-type esterase/lipase family protein [Candidatus Curtissbacteria bacterium]|nr:GDSL-type esterase/lipase family protein [Candidatus Curtissbacteria bacterium]
MLPKLILASVITAILISSIFFLPKNKNRMNDTNLIVFFGNSITAGKGAGVGEDFPSIIGKTLNVPIVNAGVSGNTTGDALLRINEDVLSKKPSVVVIELGGNDLLENIDIKVTEENLDLILAKIKPTGAKIVILGTKFFVFQKKYEADWASLAKKYDATFVPDILEGVITNPSLKFDDIHPNAKGYQKIAEKLTPIIAPLIV